jgi:hypothetical protein
LEFSLNFFFSNFKQLFAIPSPEETRRMGNCKILNILSDLKTLNQSYAKYTAVYQYYAGDMTGKP